MSHADQTSPHTKSTSKSTLPSPPPPFPTSLLDTDLQSTLNVLNSLSEDQFLTDPRLHALRKSLFPLATRLVGKVTDNIARSKKNQGSRHDQLRKHNRALDRQMDAQRVNQTKLRAARLARLQALHDGSVPDGPALEGPVALTFAPHPVLRLGQPASLLCPTGGLPLGPVPFGIAPAIPMVLQCGADGDAEQPLAHDLGHASLSHSLSDPEPEPSHLSMPLPQPHPAVAAATASTAGASTVEPAEQADDDLLLQSRMCFMCKVRFCVLHFFYADFCPPCAALNYAKRNAYVDLRGRVAIVTGGRVKIGFQVALRLLRCGARVIITSRFPVNAAERFSAEPDYATWASNLTCYGLDLRHMGSVEEFAAAVGRHVERLDILINNACQTVRRPAAYYAHLLEREQAPIQSLPEHVRAVLALPVPLATGPELVLSLPAPHLGQSALLSQLHVHAEDSTMGPEVFPPGKYDVHGQQVDLRTRTSWSLHLHEVDTTELGEVFLINAMAPFVLNAKLKPVMQRCPDADKFIVNVSAMEGKFYRVKTVSHPHTNMAKAALNMMTRTSAADYKADRIFMTSVDTGWINDENPREIAAHRARRYDFQTPLDEVDAAARILDPIFVGLTNGPLHSGLFFKDYEPTEW